MITVPLFCFTTHKYWIPQGCVLSAILFTLYTNNLRSTFPDCEIIKYADDTIIIGLISNNETNYKTTISNVSSWCQNNFLNLNISKTKEMIFCLNKKLNPQANHILIDNSPVEIVEKYKYLGVYIDNKLNWNEHISYLKSSMNKRLFLLRTLRKFNINKKILANFCDSSLLSVLTYAIQAWYPPCNASSKIQLQSIVNRAVKISQHVTKDCTSLCNYKCIQSAKKILSDNSHPLASELTLLPSKRRLNVPFCRLSKHAKSFIPYTIILYNNSF